MGWLVIVLGGLLSAIGVMAIKFGWEIVRDERGWTQVISGSVCLSGGVVTIALGLVVLRLGGMRADLAQLLRERTGPAPTPEPTHEPAAETSAGEPAKPPERKRRKDLLRKPTSASDDPSTAPKMLDETATPVSATFASTRDSGALMAGVAAAGLASAEDLTAAAVANAIEAGETKGAAAPERPRESDHRGTERAAEAAVVEEGSKNKLQETLGDKPQERSEHARRASSGKAEPFSYDRFEEELAKLDQLDTAAEPRRPDPEPEGTVPAKVPESKTPPKQEPVLAAVPKPTVVGQYEAGGVSYIMYADGSIEADTPNGVYRFMDINELKAFIQSQGSS